MSNFCPLFAPVGVGTFHMETAHAFFQESSKLLQEIDPEILIPEDILLSVDRLKAWLKGKTPDLIIFQNNTFANAAYMAEVLRTTDCPDVARAEGRRRAAPAEFPDRRLFRGEHLSGNA